MLESNLQECCKTFDILMNDLRYIPNQTTRTNLHHQDAWVGTRQVVWICCLGANSIDHLKSYTRINLDLIAVIISAGLSSISAGIVMPLNSFELLSFLSKSLILSIKISFRQKHECRSFIEMHQKVGSGSQKCSAIMNMFLTGLFLSRCFV